MKASRNSNLGPSHLRAKKRRLFFVRSGIVLFFFLVLLFGLAIFSGHEKVIIKEISIQGNISVSENDILNIFNQNTAKRYWHLFAKKNFLIFPRLQIKQALLSEIKTIQNLNISWAGWGKVQIAIDERKPHSVWCGNDSKALDQSCFFVDKDGYIYSKAPIFSGSVFIKNYGDCADCEPIGKYFLNKFLYTELFNLISILAENNLKVISLIYEEGNFKFVLESGPILIFNNANSQFGENDFERVFMNLFTAIATKDLDINAEAENIEYIDLRFANKIVIGKKVK